MQYRHFPRGQELQAPGQQALVHVHSGVLRVDLVDARRKRRLFLHLVLPGDHVLLAHGEAGSESHCASVLTPVTVQILQVQHAQFGQAMQALPRVLMRRHAEAMQLKAAPTIAKKIEALFQILRTQAGLADEDLFHGTLLQQVQVASILGVAPESVSRALRDMRPLRVAASQNVLRMRV